MGIKQLVILFIVIFIAGACAGVIIDHKFFPTKPEILDASFGTFPVVSTKVEKETQIQYVPKEIDQKTGEKEKTDVDIDTQPTVVYVRVNDKDFQIPTSTVKEDNKFQNGKVKVDQTETLHLDLKVPEKEKRRNDIALMYGLKTKDVALNYNRELGNVITANSVFSKDNVYLGFGFKF